MQGSQDDGRNGSGVLIDQRFLVLPDMPCGDFAGLPAFVAEPYQPADHAGRGRDRAPAPLIAVRTRRDAPPTSPTS